MDIASRGSKNEKINNSTIVVIIKNIQKVVEQRNPYYENTGFGRVTLGFVVLRFLSPVT